MPCRPSAWANKLQIPNCDDPIFLAWCKLCQLAPGNLYDYDDVRIAQLENLMQGKYADPSYDPHSDPADDFLTEDP